MNKPTSEISVKVHVNGASLAPKLVAADIRAGHHGAQK
jgi:hypothetical protein